MKALRLLAVLSALAAAVALQAAPLNAQTPRAATRAKPPARAVPPAPLPVQVAVAEQKCLRALNGACTDPTAVEAARLRAIIIPAVRVSYLGTPAGTIGGDYIPFERFFQDNALLFGLPTFTFVQPCCVTRTR
jgi:hypothetical protein